MFYDNRPGIAFIELLVRMADIDSSNWQTVINENKIFII